MKPSHLEAGVMDTTKLENALNRHPRMAMAHLPTRIERMSNMSDEMELELWVKGTIAPASASVATKCAN